MLRWLPSLLLFALPALAARKDLAPLIFQADRNNVQVLSQRFEYALIDKDKLRIGDVLIDSAQLRFALEGDGGSARLRFFWPAALLTSGRVSLLNNNGKAIWSGSFEPKSLKISRPADLEEDEETRSEIAEFASESIGAELMETLKFLPFLNFCVSRDSGLNKIYLCSQDLFVGVENGRRAIRARSGVNKEARVEINGREVTSQGIVYLNDASESLFIRTVTESGASIELITRKKDVDFKDVTSSTDGKRILIVARGAEPARKDNAKKIADDEWELSLSKGRPFFFILGEGGIPMRQEFFVRGELPSEDLRPYLAADSPRRTFRSSVTLEGVHPSSVAVKNYEPTAELKSKEKNRFEWTLKNLTAGQTNRRYVLVEKGPQRFVAGYDIFRGSPSTLDMGFAFDAPAGVSRGLLSNQTWLESMRWGWLLEWDRHLTSKQTYPPIDSINAGLMYRASPGFVFIDPTWGAGLLLGLVKIDGETSLAPGFHFFWQDHLTWKPPSWIPDWIHWWEGRFRLFPASSGGQAQLGLTWSTMARGYIRIGDGNYAYVGAGLHAPKTSLALEGEKPQLETEIGFTLNF